MSDEGGKKSIEAGKMAGMNEGDVIDGLSVCVKKHKIKYSLVMRRYFL
jgi:hypothetical protein